MRKIMIIDIDGCVCEHIDNEELQKMATAKPIQDSIKKINQWYGEGHFICFFTAREEKHKKITENWLKKHGIKYHKIVFGKPRRLIGDEYHYIDDMPVRASRFKGKFTDFVKKKKDVLVFEND